MYVLVELDPATGEHHVLFRPDSMTQIHASLDSARRHYRMYVDNVEESSLSGGEQEGSGSSLHIYHLVPVPPEEC